jgi:hypothetical protein
LRPIQGDQRDVAFGCKANVLVAHPTILSTRQYTPQLFVEFGTTLTLDG